MSAYPPIFYPGWTHHGSPDCGCCIGRGYLMRCDADATAPCPECKGSGLHPEPVRQHGASVNDR